MYNIYIYIIIYNNFIIINHIFKLRLIHNICNQEYYNKLLYFCSYKSNLS